ncbi:MAG: hypothetical protein JEZ07_08205 [Phycisphaerae bacterium]|nr:hypothetical protein [Phycisphaerae bacterium]
MSERKILTLNKDGQQFLFRYDGGSEEQLLDSFVDMANDQDNEFDWFDAAVLSFQLSRELVEKADELLTCPSEI